MKQHFEVNIVNKTILFFYQQCLSTMLLKFFTFLNKKLTKSGLREWKLLITFKIKTSWQKLFNNFAKWYQRLFGTKISFFKIRFWKFKENVVTISFRTNWKVFHLKINLENFNILVFLIKKSRAKPSQTEFLPLRFALFFSFLLKPSIIYFNFFFQTFVIIKCSKKQLVTPDKPSKPHRILELFWEWKKFWLKTHGKSEKVFVRKQSWRNDSDKRMSKEPTQISTFYGGQH